MKSRELSIQLETYQGELSFEATNDRPLPDLESDLRDFIYRIIVFDLLILAQDYSLVSTDETYSNLETYGETYEFLDRGVLKYIATQYPKVLEVQEELIGMGKWYPDIFEPGWVERARTQDTKWIEMRSIARKTLRRMGVPPDSNLEEYGEKHVGDISFLY